MAVLEAELAEQRKAAKDIMSAIEQGIIMSTTKEKLLEIEGEISALEATISVTEAAAKPIDIDYYHAGENNTVTATFESIREDSGGGAPDEPSSHLLCWFRVHSGYAAIR